MVSMKLKQYNIHKLLYTFKITYKIYGIRIYVDMYACVCVCV